MPETMPADERGEREVLNRLRTFIICYIADRNACLNLGKPFTVPEVELIRNVNTLFTASKYRLKSDGYLVSLVELHRIMTRYVHIANPMVEPRSARMTVRHLVFSNEPRLTMRNRNKTSYAPIRSSLKSLPPGRVQLWRAVLRTRSLMVGNNYLCVREWY